MHFKLQSVTHGRPTMNNLPIYAALLVLCTVCIRPGGGGWGLPPLWVREFGLAFSQVVPPQVWTNLMVPCTHHRVGCAYHGDARMHAWAKRIGRHLTCKSKAKHDKQRVLPKKSQNATGHECNMEERGSTQQYRSRLVDAPFFF